jgi:riboflavin kinase/FMN adenylyltransferase
VLGIEQTIVVRFTEQFASIRANDFLREVVKERLQAREVYLGKGFAFGHNREGNIELLKRMGQRTRFCCRRGSGSQSSRQTSQFEQDS